MPAFETTRRVAFTPTQMFDLVADVERYPEFLPLCEGLRVLSREQAEGGDEVIVAAMDVGYKAVRETFTSRVRLDRAALRVSADLVNGPFRHLENRWSFVEAPGGCDVRFAISYEFKSLMLQMLMGALFDQAFRKFTEAFEERARRVYATTVST
ncbi:MAG: type II toxin-antitoxin system RatA family toxin [Hyphomicrobiaceae bacterium]